MKVTRESYRYQRDVTAIWSARQKWKNPLAGLRFFRRDSGGGLILVSRHWPHQLCWSWVVAWRWPDGGKSGSHHTWGFHKSQGNSSGWYVFGPIWVHWQAYDMPSRSAEASLIQFLEKQP